MAKNLVKKLNLKIALILSLLVRLLCWPWLIHGDVNATYWWGKFAAEFGLKGFYNWLNFGGYGRPDQPMLNILYDLVVRRLFLFFYHIFWFLNTNIPVFPSKFMQWYFDNGNQYLLKLPMIIADIFLIYFSYRFIETKFGPAKAKLVSIILALYPPLVYNSAVWGSGDSIVNLLALLSIYFLWQRKYLFFSLLYIFSVLYKPSLLIWAPIFLIIAIKNKISFKDIALTIMFSLILIYLICVPFSPSEINPLIWFTQTMSVKILPGFMPHLTANAMNFWAFFYGLNLKPDSLLIAAPITARLFSLIVCLFFYVFILCKLYKNYSLKYLLLTLVNITMVTFIFMTRMHERYTFPALIPLLLLCFYDRRFIKYFILLSLTHSLNVYFVWLAPSLLDNNLVVRSISFVNIMLTLKLIATTAKH